VAQRSHVKRQQWQLLFEPTMGVWHSDPASNGSNASIRQSLLKDFPEFALTLSSLLQNVLSFPKRHQSIQKFCQRNCLEIHGRATWHVQKPEGRDLRVEKVIPRGLMVGVLTPILSAFQGPGQFNPSITEGLPPLDNYSGILTLAWAYLSCKCRESESRRYNGIIPTIWHK
jgi:hypothetical protein